MTLVHPLSRVPPIHPRRSNQQHPHHQPSHPDSSKKMAVDDHVAHGYHGVSYGIDLDGLSHTNLICQPKLPYKTVSGVPHIQIAVVVEG